MTWFHAALLLYLLGMVWTAIIYRASQDRDYITALVALFWPVMPLVILVLMVLARLEEKDEEESSDA